MKESLETALRRLRLSGLASTLDVRLQEAKANRLNHPKVGTLNRSGVPARSSWSSRFRTNS